MSFMSTQFDPSRHKKYEPRNKEKYVGKDYPICRSGWEVDVCRWLDMDPRVKRWASEAVQIPYFDPSSPELLSKRPKRRTYYPDFIVQLEDKSGKIVTWIIEVKPYKETQVPKTSSRKSKSTMLHESQTFMTNRAKWLAAQKFCKERGYRFMILTEKTLYNRK